MGTLKKFIAKYFSSFTFFYSYLGNKIFFAFILSVGVGFLDSLGLTMFFPLLQVVGNEGVDPDGLGKMRILVEALDNVGISMTLLPILVVMIIFFGLKGLVTYISEVYIIILQQSFIRSIRLNLMNGLNRMTFERFVTADVGRIQNTMSGEVDRVSRAFKAYFKSFQYALMVVVYMGFAFFLNAQFALLVTIGGGLTNFLYKYIYKHTKGASRKLTRYNSKFQGQIIQHVGHFKYLKATGMVMDYGQKLRDTILKIERSRRKIGVLASVSVAVREPLLVTIVAVVILVQVNFFGGHIGTIIISLLFFYRALFALTTLQQHWNKFMEVSGSLENMKDFQKELAKGKETDGTKESSGFKEKVVLEGINFSYGQTKILKDINLQINKNESLAFVGESGSGKTTLVNFVAGLLTQGEGAFYIDNKPFQTLKKETYQKHIGYVSQDPVVFDDTLYNNITFWAPQTPENITRFEKSIQQASLQQFLDELPKKEETELGSNGINLSGGQKQRVSIARELFKEIDILILDEATSALDSETEKAIKKSIDALQGQYTILIVAHRLATIRNADRIVFMDKGEILAIDDFEGLLKNQKRFKKMVELQEL